MYLNLGELRKLSPWFLYAGFYCILNIQTKYLVCSKLNEGRLVPAMESTRKLHATFIKVFCYAVKYKKLLMSLVLIAADYCQRSCLFLLGLFSPFW